MATLFVDKIDPQSGTSLEIGSSGDTITIPAGATITNNGTQTGFGANTPIVSAYSAGDQSVANTTWTQITFGTEEVDSDSAFASSTFTVPSGKDGKYLIISMVKLGYENNTTQKLSIYKNGSSYVEWNNFRNDGTMDATQTISAIISLAATDTIKIYNWQGTGGNETIFAGTKSTRIDITRLIT